jgi:hypothetical protein
MIRQVEVFKTIELSIRPNKNGFKTLALNYLPGGPPPSIASIYNVSQLSSRWIVWFRSVHKKHTSKKIATKLLVTIM